MLLELPLAWWGVQIEGVAEVVEEAGGGEAEGGADQQVAHRQSWITI